MVELQEITFVPGLPKRVFDLARSIDVHLLGNRHAGEQAVAGVRSGLIGPDEEVTWMARHFGIRQRLTSRITAFDPPWYFQDTMQRGPFHFMQHDHYFTIVPHWRKGYPETRMHDVFRLSAPLGPLGRMAERLVLREYMRRFLRERNGVIRQVASDGSWRKYVPSEEPAEFTVWGNTVYEGGPPQVQP